MNKRKQKTVVFVALLALLMSVPLGCGKSDDGLSLQDIPRYPNATEGESMAQSSPGGFVGGEMMQFTTADPFDDVLDFYTDALDAYAPEVSAHTSELGRQTAFNLPKKNGLLSVAIQEITEEGNVNITFMAVGS